MNATYRMGVAALATIAGFGVIAALAQSQTSSAGKLVPGESGTVFGAPARSWARLAADGSVLEAGVSVPLAGIQKAPAMSMDPNAKMDDRSKMPPPLFELNFPEAVRKTTFLDHADGYWNPMGHGPVYAVPHFDFHFFTISKPAVAAIDCEDATQADPSLLAQGYVPAVPPNAKPGQVCVPRMGYHSLPVGDLNLKPGEFARTMIAVYYAGKLNAIEPMLSKDALLEKKSFTLSVPHLSNVGRTRRFPSKFEARFDAKADSYDLVFSDFVTIGK